MDEVCVTDDDTYLFRDGACVNARKEKEKKYCDSKDENDDRRR